MKLVFLISLFSITLASAKTVARIADFGGKSFLFYENGASKEIQYADKIPDQSQLMVDDQAYVTLVDDHGNIHYLAGGSFVKIYNNMLEVQNGYVWTKAHSERPSLINTINSVTKFEKGEYITTVNSLEKKSQLLVLFGQATFASSTEPNLSIPVRSGEFTFIDQDYENGLPRRPTRVGIASYQQVKSVFANISSLKTDKFEEQFLQGKPKAGIKRQIASVESAHKTKDIPHASSSHKRGSVMYIKTYGGEQKREPQSVKKPVGSYDYYKSVKKSVKKVNKAPVKYYGFDFKKAPKTSAKSSVISVPVRPSVQKTDRQPASVRPTSNVAPKQTIINDINSVFEKSYKSNLRQNLKHSDEVNELIDELKTFRKDFKKSY